MDYVDIVFANRNDVNSPMEGDERQNIYVIAATVAEVCWDVVAVSLVECRDRSGHDVCN